MSDALYYVFSIVAMGLIFMWLKKQRRDSAATLTPVKQEDAARAGWTFETGQTAIFEIFRWRGTTAGVSWVLECLRTGRMSHSTSTSATRILRWYTLRPMPVHGPVAILEGDGRADAPKLMEPAGDGMVEKFGAKLVAKAMDKAFDVMFGDELGRTVDVGTMSAVPILEQKYPGSSVFATSASHAETVFLFHQLDASMRALDAFGPTSVLVAPAGLAFSARHWVTDVAGATPYVKAGVALVKSAERGN